MPLAAEEINTCNSQLSRQRQAVADGGVGEATSGFGREARSINIATPLEPSRRSPRPNLRLWPQSLHGIAPEWPDP